MSRPLRIGFIGNSLPRRCGIATFTNDLQHAIAGSSVGSITSIVAMTDGDRQYDYPPVVEAEIRDELPEDYRKAADHLNAARVDVVSLQHEFGIFGGEAGDFILPLMARLNMPIVTTLHTVLANPSVPQYRVLNRVIELSRRVVVMARKGEEFLRGVYRVPAEKIAVIPHGIPSLPTLDPTETKQALGFGGSEIILTFGLLSPDKGIEIVIDAMPRILEASPTARYVVLGTTHPNLVRQEGEAYRERLQARARALGIEDRVIFRDQFVDQPTLLSYISMCDVYVTPYLKESQMTSGTLAYSFGLGKAVVSTPFWHAEELLADGRGVLVPFGDPGAMGTAIGRVLTDGQLRSSLGSRAYAASRSMTWERTAARYVEVFRAAMTPPAPRMPVRSSAAAQFQLPPIRTEYLKAMCDDTGLLQHACYTVPDRTHGYCVDDNARALVLACRLNDLGEKRLPDDLVARLCAFLHHAWNPTAGRFRNFMSFERRWLDEAGSEDSHGRALWALGECARADASRPRRKWAATLFAQSLPPVEHFTSPRAWAFTLIGLNSYCAAEPGDDAILGLRRRLADRLARILAATASAEWHWFEDGLSYDNARLSEALIVAGRAMDDRVLVDAGLETLRWLMEQQTSETGRFRPVGTDGFGGRRMRPETFDQQPLEATATIAACLAAQIADPKGHWLETAVNVFNWFLGDNDLQVCLADIATGSCGDGLHPDRPNGNRGAESALSYVLALAEMRHRTRIGEQQGVASFGVHGFLRVVPTVTSAALPSELGGTVDHTTELLDL